MEKKDLPIGIQTFRRMREDDYVYVDKTQDVFKLCRKGGSYFLSRPRRFGKSLLVSTMKELFEGSRDLFKGLWIEDKWDWTQTNPVIHLSFLWIDYEGVGLEQAVRNMFSEYYQKYDLVEPENVSLKLLFGDLLRKIHAKHGKVVILIDEYDKPINDYLEFHKIEQAKINQEVMGVFYSALKEAEPYIQLLFITGVSKFAKVSLFSKLNNLRDLTLDTEYSTITGYTQTELEENFEPYINAAVAKFVPLSRNEVLELIKLWYNGFSWDGEQTVYNPFGTLLFFVNLRFQDYWFETGTPTFLIKKVLENPYFEFETVETDLTFLNNYTLDNVELTSLMFQTGYLTIKEMNMYGDIVLSYPNLEVRKAMYNFLISGMGSTRGGGGKTARHLKTAFMKNDLKKAEDILTALFGGLTYEVYQHREMPQIEAFYHGLIHLLFQCLGLDMQSEVHTARGRADAIVETPSHVYFLEFKINSDPQTALRQIKNRQYYQPYVADPRQKIGIGINFNHPSKIMDEWLIEEF